MVIVWLHNLDPQGGGGQTTFFYRIYRSDCNWKRGEMVEEISKAEVIQLKH